MNQKKFRQWSVRITGPHVLHKLVIHQKHDKYPNFIGFQTEVQVRHNQRDTRQDTQNVRGLFDERACMT